MTKAPFPVSQILVPVDMGTPDASGPALATAAWHAGQTGARVHVLTVVKPLGGAITELPASHQEDFEAFVAGAAARHGCAMTAVLRSHESPDHVIRETVKSLGIDLVVMTTHHPSLTDRLLGSHASRTALHADCSVLVLRGE
jgi:nucleotide-binding universal stress UspA family protein